ncbi:hypothetical protein D3C76_1865650 [compost metagenome]
MAALHLLRDGIISRPSAEADQHINIDGEDYGNNQNHNSQADLNHVQLLLRHWPLGVQRRDRRIAAAGQQKSH